MIIREIDRNDSEAILQLNELSVEVLSPLDDSKLQRLLQMSALSVIAELSDQVAGFMLALTQGAAYESPNYQWFSNNYENFLYIDRVVVSGSCRGQGIASAFYEYAANWASRQSIPTMLAEIDIEPPNDASLLFHKKTGFVEVQKLKLGKQKVVSLQQLIIE